MPIGCMIDIGHIYLATPWLILRFLYILYIFFVHFQFNTNIHLINMYLLLSINYKSILIRN